ncbi:hypothetical protein B8W72_26160 [Pseudomonas putida]|uniref:AAA+ ATPase domain-containing protein n=1 Tax=Pseudomonas putida TaxID=303 RepID=A0A1Y3KLS2_PSEPU|nr:hypothetical protein B8W72_26160 [Pseudomonas putida]
MGGYGYNLLFTGPPGTGKTLLASRLPGLLPPLDEHEALEVAAIQSVSGHTPLSSWPQRPFRHPHHSASGPALVGGSSRPQPGEITLAHHGVLFLDELQISLFFIFCQKRNPLIFSGLRGFLLRRLLPASPAPFNVRSQPSSSQDILGTGRSTRFRSTPRRGTTAPTHPGARSLHRARECVGHHHRSDLFHPIPHTHDPRILPMTPQRHDPPTPAGLSTTWSQR